LDLGVIDRRLIGIDNRLRRIRVGLDLVILLARDVRLFD
jgi:hypothetical protein